VTEEQRTTRPSAGPPALQVDHLTKRFGDRVAFEDVSFTIAPGEVFGFLGPNGAEKTTTVRTLGTLMHRPRESPWSPESP
jgi:ABC-2 type transport system ATP-binding protein